MRIDELCDFRTAAALLLPAALISLSWFKYRGLEYVLINYRWVFVVFFLMPMSIVYDVYFAIRNRFIFSMNSAPHQHDSKVLAVQKQVSPQISAIYIYI